MTMGERRGGCADDDSLLQKTLGEVFMLATLLNLHYRIDIVLNCFATFGFVYI